MTAARSLSAAPSSTITVTPFGTLNVAPSASAVPAGVVPMRYGLSSIVEASLPVFPRIRMIRVEGVTAASAAVIVR